MSTQKLILTTSNAAIEGGANGIIATDFGSRLLARLWVFAGLAYYEHQTTITYFEVTRWQLRA